MNDKSIIVKPINHTNLFINLSLTTFNFLPKKKWLSRTYNMLLYKRLIDKCQNPCMRCNSTIVHNKNWTSQTFKSCEYCHIRGMVFNS